MIDLGSFTDIAVLCVGDVMLDRFITGDVKRISPESPVPVLLATNQQDIPGGAANVGRNIHSLGGKCILIGAIGEDSAGRELTEILSEGEGIHPDMVTVASRPTAEKTRFVAQGHHLLRMDREKAHALPPEAETAVIDKVANHITNCQALILSDYAKGVLTDRVVAASITLAKQHGVPVIVDPKSPNFHRYDGATVVTPNMSETAAAVGVSPTTDALAEEAGRLALRDGALASVLITRAEHGMTLIEREAGVTHLKASAREVFDVVGAGDTVVATLALALGSGRPLVESSRLANAAAGLVVGKHGTATVTQSELLDELGRLSLIEKGQSETKYSNPHALAERRKQWERDGLTVGFTNGCFDILHIGHLHTLEFARAHCDRLIVALNGDESIRRLKGPTRPINGVEDRVRMLSAMTYVDAVVVFDQDTPSEVIDLLQPDVLVKGADYAAGEIVGAKTIMARGGKVLTCPLIPDRSTTRIIKKAQIA
ncbi:D-glycero-beta-D-manno-heptose-7-phosphate kinase [Rhodoblastus acidophilus]|uniref:Bifunctional protein HldE n=1 Tax=Candidatus Rhodoblastus alkanivorans TaxID=2954117 RepID=A0ABS9Z8A3_9HYPH|nr:D-glycero-beta-D-manno-heptose-7-phosphate kinase [Candidatus Rhodoblastus alkanivorans]MCI4683920.1 D-glycero-beta-D-manno-heptose-7-phosphate kinase [Candidatus Rhodoblastus alkanivorans]MDI4641239.1 D-glycero-beta-D-manno-heptose-7-phosphate kinase [Rhodoblastus acidophilus]